MLSEPHAGCRVTWGGTRRTVAGSGWTGVEPGATAVNTNPYAPPSPFAPPPPHSPSTGAADVHLIVNVVLIIGGTLFGAFALLFQDRRLLPHATHRS